MHRFLDITIEMAQCNKYLCSIYFVPGITGKEGCRREDVHMLHANAIPFNIRKFNNGRFLVSTMDMDVVG